jgi:hypothetical protein
MFCQVLYKGGHGVAEMCGKGFLSLRKILFENGIDDIDVLACGTFYGASEKGISSAEMEEIHHVMEHSLEKGVSRSPAYEVVELHVQFQKGFGIAGIGNLLEGLSKSLEFFLRRICTKPFQGEKLQGGSNLVEVPGVFCGRENDEGSPPGDKHDKSSLRELPDGLPYRSSGYHKLFRQLYFGKAFPRRNGTVENRFFQLFVDDLS